MFVYLSTLEPFKKELDSLRTVCKQLDNDASALAFWGINVSAGDAVIEGNNINISFLTNDIQKFKDRAKEAKKKAEEAYKILQRLSELNIVLRFEE